jgi:hypothetical protein
MTLWQHITARFQNIAMQDDQRSCLLQRQLKMIKNATNPCLTEPICIFDKENGHHHLLIYSAAFLCTDCAWFSA